MYKTYSSFLYHNFRLPQRLFCSANTILTRLLNLNKENKTRKSANMSHEMRYFDNNFTDFAPEKENQLIDTEAKKIRPEFLEKLKSLSVNLLETLEGNMSRAKVDASVYTGTAGIALLYFLLFEKSKSHLYFEKAASLIQESLSKTRGRDISFLCGDAGPLSIAAVVFYKQGSIGSSDECITRLLDLMPNIINPESRVPDELLYGRVGYLYSLLFVNKYIPGKIASDVFKSVIHAIFESGRRLAGKEKLKVPLMFEWHKTKYIGGAHGIAGILYLLIQSKQFMTSEQIEMVRQTVDFLLSIRFPSGNFPSSLGRETDKLVHWCHGAPGTIQMLCAAYETFADQRYLVAAEACGDVVWKRGLLRKGYGICHGVAGNAYSFLILYQLTNDLKHLYRACKFAEWCKTYNEFQERNPDRPYSLFEGLAGTIYFLVDMQEPLEAKFPCFTL